jgi:hypothetical protein
MITATPDYQRYRLMARRALARFEQETPLTTVRIKPTYPTGPACVPIDSAFVPNRNLFDLYADEA